MNYNLGKDSKKDSRLSSILNDGLADMKTKVERKQGKAHVSEAWLELESRNIDLQKRARWLAKNLIPEA